MHKLTHESFHTHRQVRRGERVLQQTSRKAVAAIGRCRLPLPGRCAGSVRRHAGRAFLPVPIAIDQIEDMKIGSCYTAVGLQSSDKIKRNVTGHLAFESSCRLECTVSQSKTINDHRERSKYHSRRSSSNEGHYCVHLIRTHITLPGWHLPISLPVMTI